MRETQCASLWLSPSPWQRPLVLEAVSGTTRRPWSHSQHRPSNSQSSFYSLQQCLFPAAVASPGRICLPAGASPKAAITVAVAGGSGASAREPSHRPVAQMLRTSKTSCGLTHCVKRWFLVSEKGGDGMGGVNPARRHLARAYERRGRFSFVAAHC